MLKSLKVKGLNHNFNVDIDFNDDLTILSGPNGCGKTNILKLVWYLASPNVERAVEEIDFAKASLETDDYMVEISKDPDHLLISFSCASHEVKVDEPIPSPPTRARRRGNMLLRDPLGFETESVNTAIRQLGGSSLFFPTYRRIEEGGREQDEFRHLSSAVRELSSRMSVDNHRLVASVSADDVKRLVNESYAKTSKQALELRDVLLQTITDKLRGAVDNPDASPDDVQAIFHSVLDDVSRADKVQDELFLPFSVFQAMAGRFVGGKGIRLGASFSIGDPDRTMDADDLSAGEKQVLSFLAYNGLYEDTPIIIDEPELSLHIDWQRMIVPAMLKQGRNNQLILATHSPFIYANYPEKEVAIGAGNSHGM